MKVYGAGIIGCGKIAKSHVEAILELPNLQLTAISDKDKMVLHDYVEQYQCQGYLDYKELLKNPQIDLICVCTPSGLHASMVIDALTADKHVLIEKPMALSLREADKIIATAQRMNKKVAVIHPLRFNPPILELKRAIDSGYFGELTHSSVIMQLNRDDNYYRQAAWRGTWKLDGGCLMNQGIHGIDLLQWLLGPVESVFGYTATKLRKIETEDVGIALLKFRSGVLGLVEAATTIYPVNLDEKLSVFGEKGSVVLNGKGFNNKHTWRFADGIGLASKERETTDYIGHKAILHDFVVAIERNLQPSVDCYEGRKALEIVLAIYHSAKMKTEIRLPLEEQFVMGVGTL